MKDFVQATALIIGMWNGIIELDCVNMLKSSEAANLVFQEILVLNWVKHGFSLWVSSAEHQID